MTNFDFLKQEPQFYSFSDVAVAAERILGIDMESSVINCRRAMEFAIKWMYSVDKSLEMIQTLQMKFCLPSGMILNLKMMS